MPEAVVALTLVFIGQDAIGLGGFLELVRSTLFLVAVRVVLQRQLAVGGLDVGIGRIAGDAEDFVVIALAQGLMR